MGRMAFYFLAHCFKILDRCYFSPNGTMVILPVGSTGLDLQKRFSHKECHSYSLAASANILMRHY